MRSTHFQSGFLWVALAAMLLNTLSLPQPRPAFAQPAARPPAMTQDTPVTLVPSGVTSYALVSAQYKLYWHTARPGCPPTSGQPEAAMGVDAERISRIPKDGGLARVLYEVAGCGLSQVTSNIVADDNYLYWTTGSALVRLSVNANPGDAPELVNGLFTGRAELAVDSAHIFVLSYDNNDYATLYRVVKSSGTRIYMDGAGQDASRLQVSYSFISATQRYYAYWLVGGDLRRFNVDTLQNVLLDTGVTGYYAEGGRTVCGISCFSNDIVFYATGRQAHYFSNLTGMTTNQIYTSQDLTGHVFGLAADGDNLFVLEHRDVSCLPFTCYNYVLVRTGRSSDAGQVPIYNTGGLPGLLGPDRLTTDGTHLYWQENQTGALHRLPNNAAVLQQINMQVTGMSITQGIQRPDNTVLLVENKRTFVRVFVKADSSLVPGVTAMLEGYSGFAPLGTLQPVNEVGTKLTVYSLPWRSVMDMSFLFELPWSWTTAGPLTLVARLNPYQAQLEPNYADNVLAMGAFEFLPSPRLQVQFVAWGYTHNNQTIFPRYDRDILQAFSWIRRAYPVSSAPGFSTDPTPGLRPGLWYVLDGTLGDRVRQTHPDCASLRVWNEKEKKFDDYRNLCASGYTNQRMATLRQENGWPETLRFYGMISDTAAFPRGQAGGGPNISTGPTGGGTFGWDMDGSYGDWYAAHEIGHTLGRGHPSQGNRCGHSASDPNYPHADAAIGATDETEGFDAGDAGLNLARALYPGLVWHDVMSYCENQWMSDYTYQGMYNGLTSLQAAPGVEAASAVRLDGDWLLVHGRIFSDTTQAALTFLQRQSSVANVPPLVPGPYTIQLLNEADNVLASYAFTPEASDETPDWFLFNQVVTFAPGTAQVRLVRNADSAVLDTAEVSAHAPAVAGVALLGAPNPVTGTVTLGWTASDQDGDLLHFDVFYSRDGGVTLQPLAVNLSGQTVPLDTARLGGGAALLRVVASDGVNTAHADSAPFTMADKPPVPRIVTPQDGLHIHYGQLVNLSGEAEDAQDGGITGAGLAWTSQHGPLGTGPLLSLDDLPVGANVITLTAANSQGLSASTHITVIVDDDLVPPGPVLAAGPTHFAWSFSADAAAPVTATLNLANSGGGVLNWTASTDAPWLSLSAASGAAPASLTLTASPSGIANGSALTGHIFLTSSAAHNQPAQTVTIPVALSVGYAFTHPDDYQPRYLFLPLVRH
jgi:hypothetical protein